MLAFDQFTHLSFDCYGTLIDWERGILAALRPVLDRHSIALSNDAALELYGELESVAEAGPYLRYRDLLATVMDGFGGRLGFPAAAAERRRPAAPPRGRGAAPPPPHGPPTARPPPTRGSHSRRPPAATGW